MIRGEKVEAPPSRHVRKRAAKMEVEQVGPLKFRVIPGEPGKRTRIVEFFVGHKDYAADCYAEDNHSGCGAGDHDLRCSHIEAALRELLRQDGEDDDQAK